MMSNPLALAGDDRLVDLAALRDAIAQEQFAGVRLSPASRDRLFALVSRLAGARRVTVAAILRYIPPLLAGPTQNGPRFERDLKALMERLVERDASCQDSVEATPWRRWPIWLALAGLAAAALLWLSLTRPATEAPATAAATNTTAESVAAKPSATATRATRTPRRLTDAETTALVANAGKPAPSALEAVISHPSLNWLPQAAEEASWSSRLPMPLHDRHFVRQLFKAAEPGKGQADNDLERSVERVARAAELAPAAELWRKLREPYAGRSTIDADGKSANALLRTVFVRPANQPWTVASLAAAVRARARDPLLDRADNELITRAMAIGSYELQRPLLISDAPWSRAETQISVLDRHLNWALALLAVAIGGLAALIALTRAPLSLDRLPSGDRTPHLPIGAAASLAGIDHQWLTRWREALGRSVPGDVTIDIEGSVRATAERGGLLSVRMRPRRGFASYTVAIEQRHRRDVFAAWWIRAFSAVAQSGVTLRIASFRHSLAAARQTGANASALRLLDPAPNARLLVFAERSTQQVERQRRGWSFAEVPMMIASPLGMVRTAALAHVDQPRDMLHLAPRLAALTGYGDGLDAGGAYLFDRAHDWLDESVLSDEEWYRLRGALLLHLGTDGFRWLAACSVFPVLSEPLAWDAAVALDIDGGAARVRALAARVFATPWMRAGHFPQAIRERLLLSLDRDDVTALHGRLIGQLATGEIDREVAGPPGIAGAGTAGIELDDPTLARFIITPPHLPGLSPAQLPARLRAWLMPSMSERLVRPAALWWAVPTIILCTGLVWFVPSASPGTVPHLIEILFMAVRLVATVTLLLALLLIVRRDIVAGVPVARSILGRDRARDTTEPAPAAIEQHARRRQRRIRRFLILFPLFYTAALGLVVLRLGAFIVFPGAATPKTATPPLAGLRGEIVDRNGSVLVRSISGMTIAIHPSRVVSDKETLARQLASLIPDMDVAAYRALLESNKSFAYLRRGASPALADQVHALGEPAIDFLREPVRTRLAQGSLATHVIGSVGRDYHGQSGIERTFDAKLLNPALLYQPTALSIDARVQAMVEADLAQGLASFKARNAGAVILDVRTGEVLALASLPTEDQGGGIAPPNIMTQGVYEPGSVIKPLSVAAALDSGAITLDQQFDATAPLRIGRFSISDASPVGRFVTAPETLVFSSNIAMARIADTLGSDRLQKAFRSVAFDKKPDIESGAGRPLWPTYWGRLTVMTASYGHGLAVPPLSVASAYAALVNGGTWRPATLVKYEGQGPVPGRKVFSGLTSARLRELLRLGVTLGTGKRADVAGFRVGGQTGSAAKAASTGYSRTDVVASFAGAFPMDAPRYVILVMIDSPAGNGAGDGPVTAAWTAAPLAARIIDHTGALLGVTRDTTRDLKQTIQVRGRN